MFNDFEHFQLSGFLEIEEHNRTFKKCNNDTLILSSIIGVGSIALSIMIYISTR